MTHLPASLRRFFSFRKLRSPYRKLRFCMPLCWALLLSLGMAFPATAAPSLGVMPIATKKKPRGKQARRFKSLSKQMSTALKDFETTSLAKNKREKVLRIRSKRLRKTALKRAKKKNVDLLLTTYASGKGRRLLLRMTLVDVKSKKVLWKAKLKPFGKHKKNWSKKIRKGVAAFAFSAKNTSENEDNATHKPTNDEAEAAKPSQAKNETIDKSGEKNTVAQKEKGVSDVTEKGVSDVKEKETEAKEAGAVASETDAKTQQKEALEESALSSVEKSDDDDGGGLAWLWYGSGATMGALAAGALVSSSVVFALAMGDSNDFVRAATPNADLKKSSEAKAAIADGLWITGAVLGIASAALFTGGLVSSLSE